MLKCKIQPPVLCCYADLYVSMVTDYKQTLRSLIMKLCVALFYFLKRRQREWTNPGLQNQTTQGVFVVCTGPVYTKRQDRTFAICTEKALGTQVKCIHRPPITGGPFRPPLDRYTSFLLYGIAQQTVLFHTKVSSRKKNIYRVVQLFYMSLWTMGATVYLVKLYPFHTEAITRVGPRCDNNNLGRLTQQSNSGIEQG